VGGDIDNNSSRKWKLKFIHVYATVKIELECSFSVQEYIHIHACLHTWNFPPSLCVQKSYTHTFPLLFLADTQFQFRLVILYCVSQMGAEKKSCECAIHWNIIYFASLNNTCTCCFNISTSVWPPFSLLPLLIMSYYLRAKHKSLLWFLTLVIHVSSISRSRTYLSSHKLN